MLQLLVEIFFIGIINWNEIKSDAVVTTFTFLHTFLLWGYFLKTNMLNIGSITLSNIYSGSS